MFIFPPRYLLLFMIERHLVNGQSYKGSKLVNYNSKLVSYNFKLVNKSNFLVIMTLES